MLGSEQVDAPIPPGRLIDAQLSNLPSMRVLKTSLVKLRALMAIAAVAVLFGAMPIYAVTYIQGIDVYSGDDRKVGNNWTINWTAVKNAGYKFVYIKATDGVNDIDPGFDVRFQAAASAGLYVGPYHFCRVNGLPGAPFTSYNGLTFTPTGTGTNHDAYLDATSEASDFLDSIMPYYTTGSYLPPVADVEALPDFGNATLNKTFISNWVQLFSDTVYNELGVRPVIYTSKSGANERYTDSVAAAHKLWIAWWKGTGTTSPPVQSDTPFPLWTFWQWSASEIVPGVPGSNGPSFNQTDADVFSGTMTQLTSLLYHHEAGDYNHDGTVNAADYVIWRKTKGSTLNLTADGSANDVVDNADYTYWRNRFGKTFAGSGSGSDLNSGSVPEPCSISLLLSAVFCWMFARRRR
jgi:lysozyme